MTLAPRLVAALVAGLACWQQPLQAQGAQPEEPIGELLARQAHEAYLQRVRHASAAASFLARDGATKSLEKQIAKKKAFDANLDKTMTLHAQTLESVGAPQFELEVPGLYAEWAETMRLMDRAEAAALYRPPEDLRKSLVFWRALQADRAAIDAAPWVHGPSEVPLDANLAPVTVPEGVWYLDPERCSALSAARTAIRQAARAAIGGSSAPATATAPVDRLGAACLMAADRRWSGHLAVVARGHMDLDPTLPSRADALLGRVRSRLNPVANLRFAADGAYSEAAVRWLVSPQVDTGASTLRWARTNGAQKEPIGIEYAFLAFGATQQVVLTSSGLRAAEIGAGIGAAPPPDRKAEAGAEFTVARVRQDLAPLEASIRFLPGHRYRDADAHTARHPNDAESLITGAPSPMQKGVQRILAEQRRKEDFVAFLSDHPRYLAALLGAAAVVASSLVFHRRNPKEAP